MLEQPHLRVTCCSEQQVSLRGNLLAGDGKAQALCERWDYTRLSTQQPSLDGLGPTVMRRIRVPVTTSEHAEV